MSTRIVVGDLFASGAEALVNPINAYGVSGKGLAKVFKERFPQNQRILERYVREHGPIPAGEVAVMELTLSGTEPRYIINVPTKRHWSEYSSLTLIRKSAEGLADVVRSRRIRSVAVPALGTGLGGLPWAEVVDVLEAVLGDLDADVMLYPPDAVQAVQAFDGSLNKRRKRGKS